MVTDKIHHWGLGQGADTQAVFKLPAQTLSPGYPCPSPKEHCSPVDSSVFGAEQCQWLLLHQGDAPGPSPPQNSWCSHSKAETHPPNTDISSATAAPACVQEHVSTLHILANKPGPGCSMCPGSGDPYKQERLWMGAARAHWGTETRICLVSGPLNADCAHVTLEVFLCPSRLLAEVCLLERTFFFVPVKYSEQGKVLFITAIAEQS